LHGHHVYLARNDALAAELPLRRLTRVGEPKDARAAGASPTP
jgi:hypothetical protein